MANKVIEFTLSPTGRFGLGYNVGETAEFEEKQADELVDAGYAKYAKAKKVKTNDPDKEAAAAATKAIAPDNATDKAAADAEKK